MRSPRRLQVIALFALLSLTITQVTSPSPALADFGPETGTVEVNTDELPLYYELWRARDPDVGRKPIVFLGGLITDTREDWRAFALALSKDRDVLLVDLRGVGKTGEGPTAGNYTLAQLNVDVQQLIDEIWQGDPDQQPVIVGCSDRGKIALQVGLTAAQRISGVITCGTSPGGGIQQTGPALEKRNTLLTEGKWILRSREYVATIASSAWRLPLSVRLWQFNLFTKFGSIEGVKRYENILSNTVGGVQFVSDPTLVLHGSSDAVYLPATGPALAAQVGANASFQSMSGPHAFWLTDPWAFTRVIEDWVRANVDTAAP